MILFSFALDLDDLPKPFKIDIAGRGGGVCVNISLESAEDALAYAKALGAAIEDITDDERPMSGHFAMHSVSATKRDPGLTIFLAGSTVVDLDAQAVPA